MMTFRNDRPNGTDHPETDGTSFTFRSCAGGREALAVGGDVGDGVGCDGAGVDDDVGSQTSEAWQGLFPRDTPRA
jgi:hypothetical protein